jgi:uncharacterized hydrophobic protein (TIGR00271 family)
MNDHDRGSGPLRRLRDLTGELRRPRTNHDAYAHLLRDDGRLDRHEQLRIMALLLPEQNRKSVVRFMLMLTLSVTIAVMGLAADSAAVVIGAMLIAPLMTPLMSFSAAVGLGLGKRATQAAFLVVVGSLWSVFLAVVLARILPTVTIGAEVLARTRPDVRDLIVAVAAGAAGAYATAREDMSGALPGVAVAVALVPPLAATGILIEADRRVLAEGSSLLYLTNLLAIIVSALIVLLATGVIPTIRLCFQSSRIAMTTMAIVLATVMIAIPLTTRSLDAAESSKQQSEIAATIDELLGDRQLEVTDLSLDGTKVTVELTGLDEPPSAYDLARGLEPLLGDDAEAIVRWDQRAQGIARADTPPPPDPADVAGDVINEWIVGLAVDGVQLDVLDIEYDNGDVNVVVSGPEAPPRDPDLSGEVADAVGGDVVLNVRWIQSFDPGLTAEPADVHLERVVTVERAPDRHQHRRSRPLHRSRGGRYAARPRDFAPDRTRGDRGRRASRGSTAPARTGRDRTRSVRHATARLSGRHPGVGNRTVSDTSSPSLRSPLSRR